MNLRQPKKIILSLLILTAILLAGGGWPGFLAFSGAGPTPAQGAEDLIQQGKGIFAANCSRCHRLHGGGLAGKYPALNKNPYVVGDPEPVIATVLNGQKGELGRMPAWKEKLSDPQVAAVVTYIRQAWANKAPAVTPAMVKAIRAK